MKKPTYYLWFNSFSTKEEYEQIKEGLTKCGFRIVTYFDGTDKKDIHTGLKQLIKNHCSAQ